VKPALLDVNVLLALAWPSHQHHQDAHQWFHKESRYGWTTCALTHLGFVRLSSNPAYTVDAVSPHDAASLLQQLTRHPKHQFWSALPPLDQRLLQNATGHRQVTDAYLVRVARAHDGRLVTFDTRIAVHAITAGDVKTIGQPLSP